MIFTEEFLDRAHDRSFRNKPCIQSSVRCGCFYCRRQFAATQVTEYARRDDTALCPYCGIDSVIGDASGLPIAADFLTEMHQLWFGVDRREQRKV